MSGEADLRRRVAQLAELALELLAVLLGHEADVEEAHHLPELHRRALHRPERGHDLLGGLEVAALERRVAALLGAREVGRARAEVARRLARREAGHAARCARSARSGSGPWPLGRRRRASASAPAWPASARGDRRRGGRRRSGPASSRRRRRSRVGVGVAVASGVAVCGRPPASAVGVAVVVAALLPPNTLVRAVGVADRVAEDRQLGRGDHGGADDGGQQAGDDRELPRGRGGAAARARASRRPNGSSSVPGSGSRSGPSPRAPTPVGCSRARTAAPVALRRCTRGVTAVITLAGRRSASETSATMIGVMAVASSEPRSQNIGHDDRGGDRGGARDQQGLDRDAARSSSSRAHAHPIDVSARPCEPGTMSSRPSGQRTQALWPPS